MTSKVWTGKAAHSTSNCDGCPISGRFWARCGKFTHLNRPRFDYQLLSEDFVLRRTIPAARAYNRSFASSTRAIASSAVSRRGGEVTHLSARPGSVLLIQMQTHLRNSQSPRKMRLRLMPVFQPEVPQQVNDGCGAHNPHISQRQVAHRTHRLLELARHATALAGVVAVMWPRSQFVYPAAGHRWSRTSLPPASLRA